MTMSPKITSKAQTIFYKIFKEKVSRSEGSVYGYDGNELCKNKLFRQPRSIKEILSKT